MRKLLMIAVSLLALSAAYYFVTPGDPPRSHDPWKECDKGDDQIVADSPDGAWTAWGVYLGCGGPMTITAADNIAIVKNGQKPVVGDEVLIGDWGMKLAKLVWKTDKQLQITLPINAVIFKQAAYLHDIAVEVKFEPDAPKLREDFLREPKKFVRERDGGLKKISVE
jgi:hypothetical protein